MLVERVDSNGLLPLAAAERAYPTAHAFRRFLQRTLPDHLLDEPKNGPLANVRLPAIGLLPEAIRRRFPPASKKLLAGGNPTGPKVSLDSRLRGNDG